MNGTLKGIVVKLIACLAILALVPTGVGGAQASKPPAPAAPFEGDMPAMGSAAAGPLASPMVGSAFDAGGDRLATVQNNDGGWDWSVADDGDPTNASPVNTLGPIGMGLAKAYTHDVDAAQRAALVKAGALLLTKNGNFSPSDGYLAAELDDVLGVTSYSAYVKTNFYDKLAAGEYDRNLAGTLYSTAGYVNLIQTSRHGAGIGSLAAWDIGVGLVGAASVGMTAAQQQPWIDGIEAELNLVDGNGSYDVLGLAGGLYGLAFANVSFDPSAGLFATDASLDDLGQTLASYQLATGGFTWSPLELDEGAGNESVQETAYAALALNTLDRSTFLTNIISAGDYLDSVQLVSGGWEGFTGDGENNEVTGEALWALDAAYPMGDVWVCPTGDCGHPEASYNSVEDGVENVAAHGTVHILAGTYVEQVKVTRPMTLLGSGKATTIIQSPDTLTACWPGKKPIVCVENTDADVMNLTVDGAGKGNANASFLGIGYHNASGTISGNDVIHVRNQPMDGMGNGVSIYANNEDHTARTLTVTDNTTSDYGKNGMALAGTGLTVDVNHNTVTGMGATGILAENGIQLGWGATGAITDNNVSNNVWTGNYGSSTNDPLTALDADGAAGILLYGAGANVEISGNTLTGNQFGVWSVAVPSLNVHDNTITGLAHTGHAFPTGIAIWSSDMWSSDLGFSDTATAASVTNNGITGNDYGVLVRDYVAGAPSPSATLSTNTFSINHIQVASTDGTVAIASALSGNTFDRAVTVSGGSYLPFIWSHIQDGVDAAASGDVVAVEPGTYVENVTIPTTLELAGASRSGTILQPAISNPDCGGAASSLCAGGSNVILVQANDVIIHDLTIDGDNPDLTSSFDVNGANLDARNGIITDHLSGVFNNLSVHDVTVQNIYLRGIYASSGGSFVFDNNSVTNIDADYASIAMMAFGGTGTFSHNTVSKANDGIVANWSNGIDFLDNTVTQSGGGIHTDNAGDGVSTADLIQGNTVSDCKTDGYGIFVFMPYIAPTVNFNHVTNCKIGLSDWGQAAAVTPVFTNNVVDGGGLAGSIGARISTDLADIYTDEVIMSNVTVNFSGNTFTNNATGVLLSGDASGSTTHELNATFQCNQITANTQGVNKTGAATFTNDFANNWWGDASGPAPSGTGNPVVSGINYTPWLPTASCPNTDIYIAGALKGSYGLVSGGRITPQFPVLNGPVDVQSTGTIFASERVHNSTGFINEVVGVPADQITKEYWFPWYDNLTMQTWLLIGNPSTTDTAHVHIYIAGTLMDPPGTPAEGYAVDPGESWTPQFPVLNGPVHVVSDINVFASERVHTSQGFVQETMGYPNNRLSTEYWYPWYDNLSMQTWLLVGNPSTTDTAHVHVYIAGTLMDPAGTPVEGYAIEPGQSWTPRFPVLNGPVKVISDIPVFSSERVHNSTGFVQETMGVPSAEFTTEYWFPWYDNLTMQTWLLVGNPSTSATAHVHVYIGGTLMDPPGTPVEGVAILPGHSWTPLFNVLDGPVHIMSDIDVFTSERVHTAQGFVQETMGIPNDQLTSEYWFPWYDNLTMQSWILVGKP